jgi:hypothetical protein
MRFLAEGLNPFEIQARFKSNFASEICNSKSREISELDQKREVVSFEFIYHFVKFGEFWTTGRLCFVFSSLKYLEKPGLIGKVFESVTDVVVAHRSIGLSQERRLSLVLTSSMRPKRQSTAFKTT